MLQMKKTVRLMYAGLLTISAVVLLTGTLSLWHSWQNTVRTTEKNAKNLSLSLSRQAQDTFLQVQLVLEELARNANTIYADPGRFAGPQGLLSLQKSRLPQLNGLFVYDAGGNWIATTTTAPSHNLNNADREYFIWHREHADPKIHIGHVILSRSTGKLVIPVSLRLNDAQGRFRGVMLGTISVDFFRHVFDWYELGKGDLLGLLHADGTIIYIRPFPDSIINRRITDSPLFTEVLKNTRYGTRTWENRVDGVTRIVGYARPERYPLVAVVGYGREALAQEWLRNNRGIIVLNALLLLIIILSGVLGLLQFRLTLRKHTELLRIRDELTRVNLTLQDLALIDELTGIANRRQFDFYLKHCLSRSVENGKPVSLIMMDIDYFKNYNDTFGHIAGDECLKKVADILNALPRRSTDVLARYGGEEFAFILPASDKTDAEAVARRALEALRDAALPHEATKLPEKIVTLSAGIGTSEPGSDSVSLKQAADTALYAAKYAGRNRAVSADNLWWPEPAVSRPPQLPET